MMIVYGIASVLGLGGILFIVIALKIKRAAQKRKVQCQVQTQAVVVDFLKEEQVATGDVVGMVSWYPVYEYEVNRQKIKKKSDFGHSKKIFKPGQQVTLYYNTQDVHCFYVPKEQEKNFGIIFMSIGGSLLVIGVLLLLVAKMAL